MIGYSDLPEWAKDNEFILKYYRPIIPSWRYILKSSLFQIHNETFNIFSHLLPAIVTLYLTFYTIFTPKITETTERLIFVCLYSCASVMLMCSSTFHASLCHSYNSFCFFSKLDYSGIAFMIVGSFIPWTFYAFYGFKKLQIGYSIAMLILCIVCVTISFIEKFAEPQYLKFRAGMFIALGVSTVIPVVHSAFLQAKLFDVGIIGGVKIIWQEYYLWALLLMGGLYILGAVCYALRFPEKWWPGKFDLAFNSHNIHHVFIVMAASLHFCVINWLHLKHLEKRYKRSYNQDQKLINWS